jgi:hypothetical protein
MSKSWIRMVFSLFVVSAPLALIGCGGEEPKPTPPPTTPATPAPGEGGAAPATPAAPAK